MRVAVIGGSGFIGTRMMTVLRNDGHAVTNMDLVESATHPEITTLGDIRNLDDVRPAIAGSDVVINLAAVHRDDVRPVSLYDEVNVGGAQVLVDAAQREGVPQILFTSSVAVYGLDAQNPSETTATRPFNDYGRTKLAAEQVLREWAGQDPSRGLTIVRPCVVFGEGNRGNVYTMAQQISRGRFLMVGSGENAKSMAYVGNVAAFLAFQLPVRPGVRIFNYADKPDMSTQHLARLMGSALGHPRVGQLHVPHHLGVVAGKCFDMLARLTGRPLPISSVRIEKFVASTTVDASAAMATGFQPQFTIAQGLRRTLMEDFGVPAVGSR